MNKTLLKQVNVTEEEYRTWCQQHRKSAYKSSTKAEFFRLIQEGRFMRDRSNKLIFIEKEKK